MRAPFTELEGKGGPAELEESPRGSGLRRAVGELLVCPDCPGLWASGAFHAGLLFAPRATRFSASVLTAMSISDFLQIADKAAEERASATTGSVSEHEELEPVVGVERELAVVGDHLAAHVVPHALLELVRHRLLEREPHVAHLVAVAVVGERLLHTRHRLLEHADENPVVEDVALRLRRPASVVVAEELDDPLVTAAS